ncbi:hypothetical protein LP421_16070 [Rhizobium sp. RCAM05350]|nr:hypothetical protein LP421_16070 [Rhizobium sp. RCAM05350]
MLRTIPRRICGGCRFAGGFLFADSIGNDLCGFRFRSRHEILAIHLNFAGSLDDLLQGFGLDLLPLPFIA